MLSILYYRRIRDDIIEDYNCTHDLHFANPNLLPINEGSICIEKKNK